MWYYLKIINPAIALSVFVLCTWAAIAGENGASINIFGIVVGNMTTYFFAKGLYCSLSLFIIGKILLELLKKSNSELNTKMSNSEFILFFVFTFVFIGLLAGLYFMKDIEIRKNKSNVIVNPNQIIIVESNRIIESDYLRITGKIQNNSSLLWKTITIYANIFIGGKFAEECQNSMDSLRPNEAKYFLLKSTSFSNRDIKDSLKYDLKITGIK
jgi:hypothetical protein